MDHTVTAVYPTHEEAELVRRELESYGLSRSRITVLPAAADPTPGAGRDVASYDDDLRALDLPAEDVESYRTALSRGEHLVSARVDDGGQHELARVQDIMETAVRSSRGHQAAAPSGTGLPAAGMGETPHSAENRHEASDKEVIPEVEERLDIGKREIERGAVHVRSRMREEAVEKDVELRHERVDVEHRPAAGGGERLTGEAAEAAFQERSVEFVERDQEAVVSKEAVKTGEVVVDKDTVIEEKRVGDTVRKTEVEVDRDR